jgi:hypothetical protein
MRNRKLFEESVSTAVIRNRTILSFSVFLVLISLGIGGWYWLHDQPKKNGALLPLRKGLDFNGYVFDNFFSASRLSSTYPKSAAVPRVRVNGDAGMGDNFDPFKWKLKLKKQNGEELDISLAEIKSLPKTEVIFDFKCIEGWSQVTHWAGVKFSDFIKHYKLQDEADMRFTGLITPDSGYYVGIDNKSMLHPQTILCYEMNGEPLPFNQGAPLRLIIPVKYGIKHIKRIGTIYFQNTRPADYWYERGYDYYSGL